MGVDPNSTALVTWNEWLNLSEPSFITCEMGVIIVPAWLCCRNSPDMSGKQLDFGECVVADVLMLCVWQVVAVDPDLGEFISERQDLVAKG